MKLLLLICCFGTFSFQVSCSQSEFVTNGDFNILKSEVKGIVLTLAEFSAEMREVREQLTIIKSAELGKRDTGSAAGKVFNDTTIEERVAILEFQVESLTVEVTDQGDEIDVIDEEVATIFSDQVIQDERLLTLETQSDGFEDSILVLDSTVSEIDSRLTVVNYTLDSRVSQMEVAGTVAFQADLDGYSSIPAGSVVIFDQVTLNIGNGYNGATGEFAVPTDGAGLYYFYVNFFGNDQKYFHFLVRVNEEVLCRAGGDLDTSSWTDNAIATCGAITTLFEGDVVDVFYEQGTDDTPVPSNTDKYNTFTGFRISPE